MRASKVCFLLVFLITVSLLNGCAYSLYPLYSSNANLREPGLVGTWKPQDKTDNSRFTIRENPDGTYEAIGTDPDSHIEARYQVRLVRLAGDLFADGIFDGQSLHGKDVDLPGGVVPMHFFYKFSLRGDTLEVAALNHDWLIAQFKANHISVAHRITGGKSEGDILFTASPPELRKFITQIANAPGAFEAPSIFHREK